MLRYGVVEGRRASVACSLHRGKLEEGRALDAIQFLENEAGFVGGKLVVTKDNWRDVVMGFVASLMAACSMLRSNGSVSDMCF